MSQAQRRPRLMKAAALEEHFAALERAVYRMVGPTVNKQDKQGDGAIVLAEIASAADLPFGWGVTLEPGRYRLRERADSAAFGIVWCPVGIDITEEVAALRAEAGFSGSPGSAGSDRAEER